MISRSATVLPFILNGDRMVHSLLGRISIDFQNKCFKTFQLKVLAAMVVIKAPFYMRFFVKVMAKVVKQFHGTPTEVAVNSIRLLRQIHL